MAQIRLLIDEDVRPLLADTLRRRGYDAVHVLERDRSGRSDPDQLASASTQRRAMLTHNIRHYVLLDRGFFDAVMDFTQRMFPRPQEENIPWWKRPWW